VRSGKNQAAFSTRNGAPGRNSLSGNANLNAGVGRGKSGNPDRSFAARYGTNGNPTRGPGRNGNVNANIAASSQRNTSFYRGGVGANGVPYRNGGYGGYGRNNNFGMGLLYGAGSGIGLGYGGLGGYGLGGYGGYGRYGYGGFGYPYGSFGLGALLGYGLGGAGYGLGGYGMGYGNYGYGGGGYGYSPSYTTNYATTTAPLATETPAESATVEAPPEGFEQAGEDAFKAGRYQEAAYDWRHAIVDDPQNGTLVMLLAQALFALGNFDEAAGVTQAGMTSLPQDKWGVVVENYRELYPQIGDYTTQLRAAEKVRDENPMDPALRFLLGFHYKYLGYDKQAARELDKALEFAPKDELTKQLRASITGHAPADSASSPVSATSLPTTLD